MQKYAISAPKIASSATDSYCWYIQASLAALVLHTRRAETAGQLLHHVDHHFHLTAFGVQTMMWAFPGGEAERSHVRNTLRWIPMTNVARVKRTCTKTRAWGHPIGKPVYSPKNKSSLTMGVHNIKRFRRPLILNVSGITSWLNFPWNCLNYRY